MMHGQRNVKEADFVCLLRRRRRKENDNNKLEERNGK